VQTTLLQYHFLQDEIYTFRGLGWHNSDHPSLKNNISTFRSATACAAHGDNMPKSFCSAATNKQELQEVQRCSLTRECSRRTHWSGHRLPQLMDLSHAGQPV